MMKLFGGMVLVAVSFFLLCLMSSIFGAAIGWVVGLFFSDTILGFMGRVGIDVTELQMWEVGASLGFIGGFFKSTLTAKGQ